LLTVTAVGGARSCQSICRARTHARMRCCGCSR